MRWPVLLAAVGAVLAALGAPNPGAQGVPPSAPLWADVTGEAIGKTRFWTNKVEIADLDGDGRPDLLFANGGDYSTPGAPEPNQVFINTGPGVRFREATSDVFGPTP